MIIDTHTHVIATDTKKYPLAPLFGKQSTWSEAHPIDYPDMVKANIEAGVDKAVLVQASSAYAFDNSYTADSVAAHPERYTGVFSVDVVAPDAPVSFLRARHTPPAKAPGSGYSPSTRTQSCSGWYSSPSG